MAGWALAVLVALAFVGLGRWQLGRMHEKTAMLGAVQQQLQRRAAGDAAPLSVAADMGQRNHYAWVAGQGRFLPSAPLLLDNQVRDGRVGVRVYRLFIPDAAPALLVELGWVPLDAQREPPARVSDMPATGRVAIAGLLMPPPATGLAIGEALQRHEGLWWMTRLDPDAVRLALGSTIAGPLAPRILRLDPAAPLGFTRDFDILPNTLPPERHLGYAVQWFGLAAAVLCTAVVVTVTRRRRSNRHD